MTDVKPVSFLFGDYTTSDVTKIPRFRKIDNFMYRGAKPSQKQLLGLKNLGINTIIDFTTNYGGNPMLKSEKDDVEALGMKYVALPFLSFRNPPEEYVEKFFEVVDDARKKNEKVYIHCREGKDRTGLFSAMYKINYGLANLDDAIKEMLAMGHDDQFNPNLIPYLREYAKKEPVNLNYDPAAISGRSLINNDFKK